MNKKALEPFIPPERSETARKQITALLEGTKLAATDISPLVSMPVKEVYEHLEHIKKAGDKSAYRLIVIPAECKKCGFVFRKREKLKKPGKCPICRNEQIREPLFSIRRLR